MKNINKDKKNLIKKFLTPLINSDQEYNQYEIDNSKAKQNTDSVVQLQSETKAVVHAQDYRTYKSKEQWIRAIAKIIKKDIVKDNTNKIYLKYEFIWIHDYTFILEYSMQRILKKNYRYLSYRTIVSTYDNILTLRNLVQTIFSVLQAKKYNMAENIEKFTQNKLLFSCGKIYCFKTNSVLSTEVESFFASKLGFTLEEFFDKNEENIILVKNKLIKMFHDEQDFNYFLHYVSTSITGINSFWKRSLIILGGRSSGKSLLLKVLYYSFEDLIINDLKAWHLSVDGNKSEKRSNWASELYFKRLITSSEFGDLELCSGIVKKLTGRDYITFRGLYQEERKCPVGSSLLLVNNGLIKVSETDLLDKFVFLETPFHFTVTPVAEGDKMADIDLEAFFKQKSSRLAFIQLCFQYFAMEPFKLTENMVCLKSSIEVEDSVQEIDNWFNEWFEPDPGGKVSNKTIFKTLKNHSITNYEAQKFLKRKGFKMVRFRESRVQVRGFQGFTFVGKNLDLYSAVYKD